eukprot:TRINITY_DN6974_c0_g3_i1.p1 TRINITY_DN6974_c0_g3~~TRINITY_DN6974_c0_g3_i1.p1  ORF type:complete len:453 (+),score=154.54 TRINITY_DN6974_c0_g3_i1:123-1361(+)
MTEGLADPDTNLPNESHCRLYRRWAEGGLGISITGNVQVDRRYLEAPRNVVLEEGSDLGEFKKWAEAGKAGGCTLLMQISHPGRQCPVSVCSLPIAPSPIGLNLPGMPKTIASRLTKPPREMTKADIEEVIKRFTTTAVLAEQAGFDGVEIHSAHGYLLSQFLSPLTNKRTDEYGGTPENRARLLHSVIKSIRAKVSPSFIVFVKVNSADFQRGGFEEDESLNLIKSLAPLGVDGIEISGGTYENMEALQAVKQSTKDRGAFFLEFAMKCRKLTDIPLMLTGGYNTLKHMESSLESQVDFIGLGRPLCTDVDCPQKLLSGEITELTRHDPRTGYDFVDGPFGPAVGTLWHRAHMQNFAALVPSDNCNPNCWWILNMTMTAVYFWDPMKNRKKTAVCTAILAALVAAAAKLVL